MGSKADTLVELSGNMFTKPTQGILSVSTNIFAGYGTIRLRLVRQMGVGVKDTNNC